MLLSELELPSGIRRSSSCWLTGEPKAATTVTTTTAREINRENQIAPMFTVRRELLSIRASWPSVELIERALAPRHAPRLLTPFLHQPFVGLGPVSSRWGRGSARSRKGRTWRESSKCKSY